MQLFVAYQRLNVNDCRLNRYIYPISESLLVEVAVNHWYEMKRG
jgi:hypothetical protein